MIVNPQLFNYRLIIGSLISAIAILSIFGASNYNSLKSYEQFLDQEKTLIQSELSGMITRYNELFDENDALKLELEEAKSQTEYALIQLNTIQTDLEGLSVLKSQLFTLRKNNEKLNFMIDSMRVSNERLQNENELALNNLKEKDNQLAKLQKVNSALNTRIEEASVLGLATLTANAYKKDLFGKTKETTRARSVKSIDVCLVLAQNPFVKAGKKEIYVQIVNPKNNVVADKGSVSFGKSSLIYSDKQIIDYTNDNLDFCVDIEALENDKPFEKGLYYINVFYKDQKLGSTTFELN